MQVFNLSKLMRMAQKSRIISQIKRIEAKVIELHNKRLTLMRQCLEHPRRTTYMHSYMINLYEWETLQEKYKQLNSQL